MRLQIAVLLTLGLAPMTTEAVAIKLHALPPTVRARQEGTVAGADVVEISAARAEFESFQVVVTATEGNLRGVSAQMSPLKKETGESIPAKNVTCYREVYIPIRYSSPGLIADPLVPFVNPYTNERVPEPRWRDKGMEGARFGAVGFDLWQDRHQPLWVDVEVPKGAAPGLYTGTLEVRAQNAERATVPVRLTV
ncbi:MAG: DUF6067 family protein [Phycisphaerae bacterium]|nr:DUF6067 family protein [Phycisphaerae bacterium]